jgi:hypothetical protein
MITIRRLRRALEKEPERKKRKMMKRQVAETAAYQSEALSTPHQVKDHGVVMSTKNDVKNIEVDM